jgi:hypothetical protein
MNRQGRMKAVERPRDRDAAVLGETDCRQDSTRKDLKCLFRGQSGIRYMHYGGVRVRRSVRYRIVRMHKVPLIWDTKISI